ncbi:hypothetical protein JW992_16555 [candidate division KSB1 bacterium]|nr:hypothetical protein [candidate division KSB1 bacterium]
MRRLMFALLLILSHLVIPFGCRKQTPPPVPEQPGAEKSEATQADEVRIYEYDYEWDLEGLSENHFIVLESYGDSVSGRYYGTSDDFDDFREGYAPGFFVATMDSLTIVDSRIHFSLRVIREILFSRPIDLRFTSAAQARAAGYSLWLETFPEYELCRTRQSYSGTYSPKRIEIQLPDEKRVFEPIEQLAHRTP